ncbi:MAG: hypothetical protein AAGG81_02000 [Chlamydiota bacterium]
MFTISINFEKEFYNAGSFGSIEDNGFWNAFDDNLQKCEIGEIYQYTIDNGNITINAEETSLTPFRFKVSLNVHDQKYTHKIVQEIKNRLNKRIMEKSTSNACSDVKVEFSTKLPSYKGNVFVFGGRG